MRGGIQKARFASVLLEGKARTWFMVQGFAFNEEEDDIPLIWHVLKQQLLMYFWPADYKRVARNKLLAMHQTGPDVYQYITSFNEVLNRCAEVSAEEAKFLFEEHLSKEIALQVYNANTSTLNKSQTTA